LATLRVYYNLLSERNPNERNNMSTRSIIASELSNGTIVSSYCHYDGYVTGVGMELLDSFNSEEEALRVANHGSFSSLTRDDIENVRNDTDIFNSINELTNWLEERTDNGGSVHDLEFAYLWRNGEWYVADLCGEYRRENKKLYEEDTMAYYDGFYKTCRWETLDTAFVRHARENIEHLRTRMLEMDGEMLADFEEHVEYLETRMNEVHERTISELAKEICS